jgi:hypothetical protein
MTLQQATKQLAASARILKEAYPRMRRIASQQQQSSLLHLL